MSTFKGRFAASLTAATILGKFVNGKSNRLRPICVIADPFLFIYLWFTKNNLERFDGLKMMTLVPVLITLFFVMILYRYFHNCFEQWIGWNTKCCITTFTWSNN